jgi:hypothetical protein
MATENAQFLDDIPIKTYIYRQGSSHCRYQLDMIWDCLTIGRAKNTMEIHQRGWQSFGVWPVWPAFWVIHSCQQTHQKKHLFPANILAHLSFQCWTKSVPCFRQHLRICGICRAFDAETIWRLSENLESLIYWLIDISINCLVKSFIVGHTQISYGRFVYPHEISPKIGPLNPSLVGFLNRQFFEGKYTLVSPCLLS